MVVQTVTGILLVLYYIPRILQAFDSIDYLTREVSGGYIIRIIHLNFASILFIGIYAHIIRNLYYNSFKLTLVWLSGTCLLLIIIITAFLGYVLPWGQMSFWGATVITNLLRAIPYLGESVVLWIWAGFCINQATLNFFFLLHFLLPLVILGAIIIHLIFLHITRSTSLILTHDRSLKVKFTPYFTIKDLLNIVGIIIFLGFILFIPWVLGDRENWNIANPITSPIHILPEWYFLFAYAILRCIPNKLGGVIALVFRVIILIFIPYTYKSPNLKLNKVFIINIILNFVLLTILGACPVEEPYIIFSQVFTCFYFFNFFWLVF